jgi:hypothetical protein
VLGLVTLRSPSLQGRADRFRCPGAESANLLGDRLRAIPPPLRLVKELLGRTHPGGEDYEVMIPKELLAQAKRTQWLFNMIMGAMAGISFLVGACLLVLTDWAEFRSLDFNPVRSPGGRGRDQLLISLDGSSPSIASASTDAASRTAAGVAPRPFAPSGVAR